MKIAREGRLPIAVAWIVLAGLALVSWWAQGGWTVAVLILWAIIALWVPWFFRDPDRMGPRGDNLILSPADGRVVSITEVDEPEFLKRRATCVSVFMNVFNVHVNRHPVGGSVAYRKYRPGKFVNATLDKASSDNERMSLGLDSRHGPVLVRQIAGLVARRIVTDHQIGDKVLQGDRMGIIRFGSRLETYVPQTTRISVQVGDVTRAGVTILAEWTS
jgi:phosphatidylserine decarboxylase